ncbi:MAG: polyribonucleotide nucleotidyltransferase [Epsilonproteobacteria bacterium]|nr:polyribonucleotide nucleotidyltransferase [Campylobacterota bacterium]
MHKAFQAPELGLEVEIGKYARQADGAVWIKAGKNVVLTTAVGAKEAKDFIGFFPLTVEYRERTSAAGRIPGGYIKREGRLSDIEVLTSRLIDRPIRPLFPHFFFNEVQVLSTVYSSDGKFPTSILGMLSASLALTVSDIPFLGPIGAVQASKKDGKWAFNLDHESVENSDSDIVIAGTENGISMVEGHCNNLAEDELIDLLFSAHEVIKKQVAWQVSIQKELGVQKREVTQTVDWAGWKEKIKNALPSNFIEAFFVSPKKAERNKAVQKLYTDLFSTLSAEMNAEGVSSSVVNYLCDEIFKEALPDAIIKKGKRIDDRPFDRVRDITVETGMLPCVHGSGLFQRGETQVLSSLTLGSGQDSQKIETLIGGSQERCFMLHYNFPPFCTGEVKPIRGVGRREIGHGYLAETSFLNVLPSQEEFPYTVRSITDVLESNGSSSMASVCATTMALMDAGVPIKDMVGGIAMGLVKSSTGDYQVLTDILGTEDGFGLMDFKVTGTKSGIMAFQLDIKDKVGLPREVLVKSLEQARAARLHILEKMSAVMDAPRKEVSPLAPRVFSFKIPQDKIGAIIGPGGKNIKEIIAQTDTQIDIEDDGLVKIYSKDGESLKKAERWVRILAGDIEVGSTFEGIIRRFADFGLFVELVAGKEGLVHVSSIARDKQRTIDQEYKVGDPLTVKVTAYDKETGRIRLVAPELEHQKKN